MALKKLISHINVIRNHSFTLKRLCKDLSFPSRPVEGGALKAARKQERPRIEGILAVIPGPRAQFPVRSEGLPALWAHVWDSAAMSGRGTTGPLRKR